MKKVLKIELIKLIWTIVCFLLGYFYLINSDNFIFFSTDTLDIHLHDTYFVIDIAHFWLAVFLVLHFSLNTIYSLNTKFFSSVANTIYLLEIIALYFLVEITASLFCTTQQGWTSYPPLSALQVNDTFSSGQPLFSFSLITIPFLIYLIVFMLRWWRWSKRKQ